MQGALQTCPGRGVRTQSWRATVRPGFLFYQVDEAFPLGFRSPCLVEQETRLGHGPRRTGSGLPWISSLWSYQMHFRSDYNKVVRMQPSCLRI